ncbi:MAG: hypothetical protein HYX34_06935 [Actinobacteria bacterium]|nr:hypothetical protein [Actinomycetota bacterium]
MADEQDQAESLDDDRVAGAYPPDRPLGVDAYGTTGSEERWDEPLPERVAREEPDELARALDEQGSLVAPDEGVHDDTDAEAVAYLAGGEDVGALDADDIATGDTTVRDVVQEREADVPAEEAAVHVVGDEPT